MKNILFPFFSILLFLFSCSTKEKKSSEQSNPTVILITLDGMRWQEVFGGADEKILLDKKFIEDSALLRKKYWAESPQARRTMLLPFIWGTIGTKGQLYGNRTAGNLVNVTNQMWFSYPGYNEILTGSADDEHITSNDQIDNPNKTVLEFINEQPAFKNKVAAFTSWEAFPAIINKNRNGLLVNSGITPYQSEKNSESQQLLNELTGELPFLGETRPDAITFHLGFEYLKQNKPSVLYLSFDETDHFAHGGKYDLYLNSAHYIDGFISKLWDWLQNQPEYKDNTTLIITCDHGRGGAEEGMWQHHGRKVSGADEIWMAVIGPNTPATGERSTTEQHYQNEIASTLASAIGLNYKPEGKNSGAVIKSVFN